MLKVKQLTPEHLLENQHRLDKFLEEELSPLVNGDAWMKEWKQVAQRFQLQKFEHFSAKEILALEWDIEEVQSLVEKAFVVFNSALNFIDLHITIVPALKFPWFENVDEALWTNGFTNGPQNIIVAIPPSPDPDFLQYLITHEAHHAHAKNPIYELGLENFTLEEWYKMEGAAEYFSLSLFPDKRWWKGGFTEEVEKDYWNECKQHLKTTDDRIKGRLCFGDPKQGIPTFAGYSFALKMVTAHVNRYPYRNIKDLFEIEAAVFIENYRLDRSL